MKLFGFSLKTSVADTSLGKKEMVAYLGLFWYTLIWASKERNLSSGFPTKQE